MGKINPVSGTLKLIVLLINALFLLIGLGLIGVQLYFTFNSDYQTLSNAMSKADSVALIISNFNIVNIVVIIIGLVISSVSILGLLGACLESKMILIIYNIVISLLVLILSIILIATIIIKFSLVSNSTTISERVRTELNARMMNYYENNDGKRSDFAIIMDTFQIFFRCCGVNNYTDYAKASKQNIKLPDGSIAQSPISCCKLTEAQRAPAFAGHFPNLTDYSCARSPTKENSYAFQGCLAPMSSFIDKILLTVLLFTIINVSLLVTQPPFNVIWPLQILEIKPIYVLFKIIGSVLSCCLCV